MSVVLGRLWSTPRRLAPKNHWFDAPQQSGGGRSGVAGRRRQCYQPLARGSAVYRIRPHRQAQDGKLPLRAGRPVWRPAARARTRRSRWSTDRISAPMNATLMSFRPLAVLRKITGLGQVPGWYGDHRLEPPGMDPKPEVETGCRPSGPGASASGGWFSASRRKLCPAHFLPARRAERVGDASSGATPKLARETRALPMPISEFGFKEAPAPAARP